MEIRVEEDLSIGTFAPLAPHGAEESEKSAEKVELELSAEEEAMIGSSSAGDEKSAEKVEEELPAASASLAGMTSHALPPTQPDMEIFVEEESTVTPSSTGSDLSWAQSAGFADASSQYFQDLTNALAHEDMQEALSARSASDEMMDLLAKREEKSLERVKQEGLCPNIRRIVVCSMAQDLASLRMPEKSWFDVVMLLDVYCLCAQRPVEVGDLPALCSALVMLLLKIETASPLPDSDLVVCAEQLAYTLRQKGHKVAVPAVTKESVEIHELLVLQALHWQINLPNVGSWMAVFYARTNALTGHALLPTLTSTWQKCYCLARTMSLHSTTRQSFTRRQLAQGLLGIGFVAGGFVSPDALGLETSGPLDGISMQQKSTDVPAAQAVPASSQPFFLDILQVVTGQSVATLQEDCKLMQDEMRKAGLSMR